MCVIMFCIGTIVSVRKNHFFQLLIPVNIILYVRSNCFCSVVGISVCKFFVYEGYYNYPIYTMFIALVLTLLIGTNFSYAQYFFYM